MLWKRAIRRWRGGDSTTAMPSLPRSTSGLPTILLGSPNWALNGVNVFSENLCRALIAQGHDARILVTEADTILARPHDAPLEPPSDLPFLYLDVGYNDGWGAHWGAMIAQLNALAPCIYVPNSDWRHSCVAPMLGADVGVVGVVHSDDPLHYDHVARVGSSWNSVVCVSETVARRTREQNPDLADRIEVIPIGVRIPPAYPKRPPAEPGAPLRVLYLGALKQHQKRVLDLANIAAACAARGVNMHLTIAGGGSDEAALRDACAPWVAQGLVSFAGIVARDGISDILDRHDVFILTSAFEGMPNALLEAMGRGCVPLVTQIDSAVPELVADGVAGFVVPIGDIDAFADRLALLAQDRALLALLSRATWQRVANSPFTLERMVASYAATFARTAETMRSGGFRRPQGEIAALPWDVAGVGIFPTPCPYRHPGIGAFPRRRDRRDFERARGSAAATEHPDALRDLRIVFGAPIWQVGGISTRFGDLAQRLRRFEIPARILITEENTGLVTVDTPRQRLPRGVPQDRLPVRFADGWGAHWGALYRTLVANGPTVYVSGINWRHTAIVPLLPDSVIVALVVDSMGGWAYEQLGRIGAWTNVVIAGDERIAADIGRAFPDLSDRIRVLETMVDLPARLPPRRAGRLRFVVMGGDPRDSLALRDGLRAAGAAVGVRVQVRILTLADRTREPAAKAIRQVSRDGLRDAFFEADAFVPGAGVDGQASLIREAMARGCVPVAMTQGGDPAWLAELPELVPELVPERMLRCAGVAAADLAALLRQLRDGRAGDRLAKDAIRSVRGCYSTADGTLDFMDMVSAAHMAVSTGGFRRPPGRLAPPSTEPGGVFPVDLAFEHPTYGRFPSEQDCNAFTACFERSA